MTGQIGILNVGAGDTKLTFDKNNPSECIRSARIVTDMLRRGYALLIEVDDGKGGRTHTRVREFHEDTHEYIIADFDPVAAEQADQLEAASENRTSDGQDKQREAERRDKASAEDSAESAAPKQRNYPRRNATKAVPASGVTGIAVARSAGG